MLHMFNLIVHVYMVCVSSHTELPPASPMGLILDGVDDTAVRMSWIPLSDADRYIATFTQTSGNNQQGLCTADTHRVSVESTSTIAGVGVGKMLAEDDTTMLRAYSTYSITVVAVSDLTGSSEDSEAITFTTAQISECYRD